MDRPVRQRVTPQKKINRRRQGDIGEASAIEWLTRAGCGVWIPLNHSPDFDLIAESRGGLLRVQVKTCALSRNERFEVRLCTSGGNQSWNRVVKRFSPGRYDLLFVLTRDWRKWLIPSAEVGGETVILLGGPKYTRFEIDLGRRAPFDAAGLESPRAGGAPEFGEPGWTVNPVPQAE